MDYTKGSDFAPHNMTTNSAPSPFVASASSEFGAVLKAFRAFENTLGDSGYWITNGTSIGWLTLDIGSGNSKKIYSYKIYVNVVPEPNRAPKNWTFEGSNNNIDWTILDTQENQTGWGSGTGREFTLDILKMSIAYRYFRLNISANNGDDYLQIGEMYFYEATGSSDVKGLFTFIW